MSTGLLERRSQSPSRLFSPTPSKLRSPSNRFRPPSSVQTYSSTPCVEICDVTFTSNESSTDNHTERLVTPNNDVIIRRGNTLILKTTMSVALSCSYSVSLTFVPVFRPRERFGQFKAKGMANGTHDIWLSIKLPSNFPIGKYHAHLTVAVQGGLEVVTHFHNKPIVVLFNPWDSEDDSYVESESDRAEYLENDVGTVWRGTHKHKVATKWEFGQYEDHCLDVALSLLRDLKADDCRSAAKVCRGVASQITTRDGSGVLVASFTGGHVGGMHPARWSGSPAILQKFHRSNTPVRYGQCWVFACVCVTLLRCLGIACRPVTCYNAAHYCTKLGQVERYFTTEGELVHDLSRDQLWFYHVWVEVWMRRDDLPSGYDGWQVIDPTSQDKQSGRFRVGPASVEAIRTEKSGKKAPYDAEYIISEVSADVRYLRVSSNHTLGQTRTVGVAYVNHSEVGAEIVTSSADGELVDVTSSYKDSSSLVENDTNSHTRFPLPTKDCEVKVLTSDTSKYGEAISVVVTIQNKGAFLRTVDGRVTGRVVYYTGQHVRQLLSMQFTGTICPGQTASVSVPIVANKYMRVLVEQCMMQFFVAIKVRESRQLFLQVHPYQLTLPDLEFQCPGTVVVGETFRVKIKFRNILSCSLSRVMFLVQAQALCSQREITHKRLVLPGGLVSVEVCLRASVPARSYTLLANMSCDLLKDVRGSTVIQVVPQT